MESWGVVFPRCQAFPAERGSLALRATMAEAVRCPACLAYRRGLESPLVMAHAAAPFLVVLASQVLEQVRAAADWAATRSCRAAETYQASRVAAIRLESTQ